MTPAEIRAGLADGTLEVVPVAGPDREGEVTNRAELAATIAAIIATTCPRCATDLRDCTCPGGLRSRSLAQVFAAATGWAAPLNSLIRSTRGRP